MKLPGDLVALCLLASALLALAQNPGEPKTVQGECLKGKRK
jgi:hypothetical protein